MLGSGAGASVVVSELVSVTVVVSVVVSVVVTVVVSVVISPPSTEYGILFTVRVLPFFLLALIPAILSTPVTVFVTVVPPLRVQVASPVAVSKVNTTVLLPATNLPALAPVESPKSNITEPSFAVTLRPIPVSLYATVPVDSSLRTRLNKAPVPSVVEASKFTVTVTLPEIALSNITLVFEVSVPSTIAGS